MQIFALKIEELKMKLGKMYERSTHKVLSNICIILRISSNFMKYRYRFIFNAKNDDGAGRNALEHVHIG